MSSIHIPPIPSIKIATPDGYPTIEEAIWRQQELQSRSAWTSYTPTTANISVITGLVAAYVQLGKLTFFRVSIAATTNGTALTFTLPFAARVIGQEFCVQLAGFAGTATISGADFLTVTVNKYDATTPVNGTVVFWIISGSYEAQ